ncbi:leucine rich repeat domain protein [Leptolyngbya sp. Heron Island J]|uniref:leucine-rich repeat domain-containing protein n=1 Tax=Leptolyngbya sp. Heron Island J TaxID=1385935 RepID=UPI0003B953D2|nr:leucine-rich repeat domain-containing protein [Leptolyngbya sp. Heron Island J]ESA36837.1 leucine rich repeat domain protein [Leptolyngbya sp. Heron Island J]
MAMTKDELLALLEQAAAEGWTELDLSGQGLTELPEEIGKLTQLERLMLGKGKKDEYGNQAWDNTAVNGKWKWGPLTIGNKLTELPDWLTNLSNLRHLGIRI